MPRSVLAAKSLLLSRSATRPSLRVRSYLLTGPWHPPFSRKVSHKTSSKGRSQLTKTKRDKVLRALTAPDGGSSLLCDEMTLEALSNLGLKWPDYFFERMLLSTVAHRKTGFSIVELARSYHERLVYDFQDRVFTYEPQMRDELRRDFSVLRDPALLSEALYLAAHRIWNAKDLDDPLEDATYLNIARFLLEIALEMGNRKAALDLTIIACLFPDTVLSPAALRDMRTAALERTDSRAMVVYARYLLDRDKEQTKATRELAFRLAEELSTLYEPASPHNAINITSNPIYKWESPWALLRDAALQRLQLDYPSPEDPRHEEINDALVAALRQGVNKYNDPEACRLLGDHPRIIEFSPEWIELKTKSAVDGHSDSCFNLARYYLEYWGWYPCVGKLPNTLPEARVGLDWLELSAEGHLHEAETMSYRYQLLALLMRENGLSDEGHKVIKRGINAIQNYSTDRRAKTWAVRELESFDRNWDVQFQHRVHLLLGDEARPKLTPQQRYQQPSSSGWRGWLRIK